MKAVLIYAGTTEGRELSMQLAQAGIPCDVSVATEYGKQVMEETPKENLRILQGRMDAAQMAELLKKGPTTIEEEVRAMSEVPVMFEPGSHWLYGFGSEITGVLVEHFEGKPLRDVFKDRLIDPLELEDADTLERPGNKDRLVTNYAKKGPGEFEATENFAATDPDKVPAGARPNLLISAHDFAVFMQMLANGGTYKGKKFLGSGTVAILHENHLGPVQKQDFDHD